MLTDLTVTPDRVRAEINELERSSKLRLNTLRALLRVLEAEACTPAVEEPEAEE